MMVASLWVFTPEIPSVPFSCRKPFCMSMTRSAAVLMSIGSSNTSTLLFFAAKDAGAAPAILGNILYDYVQMIGLASGVVDHRLGNRAHQIPLLRDGPPRPHLYRYHRHDRTLLFDWQHPLLQTRYRSLVRPAVTHRQFGRVMHWPRPN